MANMLHSVGRGSGSTGYLTGIGERHENGNKEDEQDEIRRMGKTRKTGEHPLTPSPSLTHCLPVSLALTLFL